LLKLRKVELVGFKSFCEKTQITFSGAGLTCIIGPNGCGKSNIVDAISWVLGEQSHKSLRAERMSDCIFNGTAKRPPLGLAEVTLTLLDQELAEAAEFVLGAQIGENGAHGPVGVPDSAYGATAGVQSFNTDDTENGERSAENSGDGDGANDTVQDALADGADSKAPAFLKKKRGAEKHGMQLKPGEVVVGRRLYRSGQSEYLINGRVARLRDIQDLFMGIGLGPDSYAIIEQGRIGQILSSKPTDRRAIIEEAAGITKFKTKRRLSEAKLESSKLNLSRVNDIYVEVEKQLASLKRQASKARRYAEIREQMRGLLRQVLASKAKELDMEADRLSGLLGGISQQESTEAQSVNQWEADQDRLSSRTYELEGELRQHQNVLGQTALELDRSENRILFNKQRTAEVTGRLQQMAAEIEQGAAQAAQVEARASMHGESVATIKAEVALVATVLASLTAATAEISGAHQSSEEHIAQLRRTAAQLGEQLTRLHGEQAQAEQTLAHHVEGVARFEQQEQQLLEESLHHRDRSQAADLHWETVLERASSLGELVRSAQTRIADLRHQQQDASKQVGLTRDALAGGRARRGSVEQILNERSYTADAVQKLFASSQGSAGTEGFHAVGVLADYAEVGQEYESAIEQFLREELEYVVVENFDVARAGIAMLRDEVGGRATFFVDSIRKLNLQANEPVTPFNFETETVSRLDKLVEFRDPLGPAAKQFLPRLQSAFLVEQADVAERLARENTAYSFVTPDGTTYQGRVVSGGRPSETGPLGMKRELRALDAEVLQCERAAFEAQASLQQIEEELHASGLTLEQATAQHVESEKLAVAATLQRDQARGDMVRLEIELHDCQADLAKLRTGATAAQQRAEAAQLTRGDISNARERAEQEIAQGMEQQIALRQTAQARQEELSTRRAEMAGLAERLASAETIAARIAHELQELVARRQTLLLQHDSLIAEQGQLATQTAEHQKQVASLREEKLRLEARGVELEKEFEDTRIRAAQMDDTLRHGRQKLGDFREQRSKLEIERAKNDSEREHLRQSCVEELNAQPEDLIAEFPALLSGEELRISDEQYHELKSRIESMGPINMMALEEYNECERRFDFLGRERTDLLQSITDTQQAIAELDEVCKLKFEEAFNFINTNFAVAFHTLFGGGTGEMRLSEPDSSGEPGIDVVAQPPGKRLQNVLLLSGGEKAMTALALLIAIFRYQPSPFCILDEVDAPLDEANVGRFTKLVSEMSAGTQFIVVTHNRRTMEMASVLYGVTMQEPGVSKLVSVRWDEPAAAKAATNAA
jgi:chromosome segregation protein